MSKPPRFDAASARRKLEAARPLRSPDGPRAATDHLILHPEEVVLEGPYVRQHVDRGELEALRQAIEAGGEVKQAIGVRMDGPPLEPRYILVYGMRRWLASKAAALDRIPVRNHGRISVGESLALQVAENEARVDPHPIDAAVSYQLLVQEGNLSQAQVARVAGRSAAHVSYMRAVGEAVLRLRPEEREALYAAPDATVPRFQKIASLKTLDERVEALRGLIASARFPEQALSEPAASFRAGPAGASGAWAVRLSYREEELRRDGELAARVENFLEEQLRRLREAVRPDSDTAPPGPVIWEIDSP